MNRSLLFASLVVSLSLAGCKKEEAKPAPAPAPAPVAEVKPAPAPEAQKPAAAEAPLEGAVPFVFSQADSKLTWVGAKITGKHEGSFETFSGSIELVGADPTKSRVKTEISIASLKTSPEKLVAHLKSPDFFAVEEWPTSTFVSTGIVKNGEAYTVTGDLTLRGQTKSLSFPATIAVTDAEVTVNADLVINRKDFAIVYPGAPDDLIADNVSIKFELHAKKKG